MSASRFVLGGCGVGGQLNMTVEPVGTPSPSILILYTDQ